MITSDSIGDPSRFRTLEELRGRLGQLPPRPPRTGRVALLVARGEGGLRQTPAIVRLQPGMGLPGDGWSRRGTPDPDAQLAVMERAVAELIANGQPLTLFGDNLFLDLDLSKENLPVGTRVRAGSALLVVTPKPHNGCRKFRSRFGEDALRFVSSPDLRHLNLRGIYLRAIEAGEVSVGDPIEVVG